MEQKKVTRLNGFTEFILVLGIINCVGGAVLSLMNISSEEISVGAGVYNIIASIIVGFFMVMLLQAKKLGLYGYLAMVVVNIISAFILCDGEYSVAFHQLTVNIFQVAILLACLFFLKANGVSGWDVIFGNNIINEENTTPVNK